MYKRQDNNPLTFELCLLTSFNLRLSIPVIFNLDLDVYKRQVDSNIQTERKMNYRFTLEPYKGVSTRHTDRDHPHCHIVYNRVDNDGDVYKRQVSKMLTHKNVTTTQIYADLVNSKTRETENKISLK